MSTTTAVPAKPNDIVQVLNQCIATCIDGEKGYEKASAGVHDPALKASFQERAKERMAFVIELQAAIRKLGAAPEGEGTTKGAIHRGWMDVRRAIASRGDRSIVREWARGELAALQGYHSAFRHTPIESLPHDLRNLLQEQYRAIRMGLDDARRRLARETSE